MIKTEDMTDGLYYVKEKHGVEVGDWDSDHKKWNGIWGGYNTEVLAPVPTFDELQNINKSVNDLMATNIKLVEENTKLKELLKDLRDKADGALRAIQKDCESDDFSIFQYPEVQYFYDLLPKINQALGEDK